MFRIVRAGAAFPEPMDEVVMVDGVEVGGDIKLTMNGWRMRLSVTAALKAA
jgi:nitrogen fixation protein